MAHVVLYICFYRAALDVGQEARQGEGLYKVEHLLKGQYQYNNRLQKMKIFYLLVAHMSLHLPV